MSDQYSVRLDIQYETIKGLKTALAEANKELENAKINTIEWTNAFKKVGELKNQMANVTLAMRQAAVTTQQTTQASANAAQALLNLNYVIRDSPYFFQNVALGVLAVGNNLNPLIDSFNRLRKEALEKNLTTIGLLKQALVGGAGLSIAFSVVVTAIQAFVFMSAKAKDKTRSLAEEIKNLWSETYKAQKQMDEFVLSLDKMSRPDVEESIKGLNKELEDLNITFMSVLFAGGDWTKTLDDFTDKTIRLIKLKGELETKRNKESVVGGGIIEEQEALVESYRILEKAAKIDSERLGWQKLRIDAEEKLNELMGKENKKGKEKIDLLDKVILSDKEILKSMSEIDTLLQRGNLSERERNLLLKERINLLNQIVPLTLPEQELYGDDEILPDYKSKFAIPAEDKRARGIVKGMKNSMKEFLVHLEMGKILAKELGDTISQAFMGAKVSLDEFIKSLLAAITQMLILRAITSFFTFVMGGASAMLAGASPVPIGAIVPYGGQGGGARKIQVTGKITADKNNFIANIRNADNYYSRNEEFVLIGR